MRLPSSDVEMVERHDKVVQALDLLNELLVDIKTDLMQMENNYVNSCNIDQPRLRKTQLQVEDLEARFYLMNLLINDLKIRTHSINAQYNVNLMQAWNLNRMPSTPDK